MKGKSSSPTDGIQQTMVWPAMVLFAVIILTGCEEPNIGVATGTVTVDGSPAESGSIAFFPVDRKSPTAGAEILQGQYTAQVPLGMSKVEIRVPKVVGEKKLYGTADSPVKQIMAESLPAKYNDESELTLDVRPGENRHDFDLKTRGEQGPGGTIDYSPMMP